MNTTVLYEGWQMECCGDPFKVGDQVTWQVVKATADSPVGAKTETIEYYEDHHGMRDDNQTLTGTVAEVSKLYQRFEETRPGVLTAVEGHLVTATEATNVKTNLDDSFSFTVYLIKLHEAAISERAAATSTHAVSNTENP